MTNQAIEVEGLPEGYRAVAYRKPIIGETCWEQHHGVYTATVSAKPCFIIEKIKPRRIVLEETCEKNHSGNCQEFLSKNQEGELTRLSLSCDNIWREVKENDFPLTKDAPKLSLSVSEVKTIFGCDFALLVRVEKFIKENS